MGRSHVHISWKTLSQQREMSYLSMGGENLSSGANFWRAWKFIFWCLFLVGVNLSFATFGRLPTLAMPLCYSVFQTFQLGIQYLLLVNKSWYCLDSKLFPMTHGNHFSTTQIILMYLQFSVTRRPAAFGPSTLRGLRLYWQKILLITPRLINT